MQSYEIICNSRESAITAVLLLGGSVFVFERPAEGSLSNLSLKFPNQEPRSTAHRDRNRLAKYSRRMTKTTKEKCFDIGFDCSVLKAYLNFRNSYGYRIDVFLLRNSHRLD